MRRWTLVTLAATAIALAGGVSIVVGRAALGGDTRFDPAAAQSDPEGYDAVHRTIFHAVLEGLYEDGVSTDLVKLMLEEDPKTRMPLHLVYSCPICDPALDALRVYEHRNPFHCKGTRSDTFGAGMPADLDAAFRSGDRKRQFEAMQKTVDRWITQRLDLMRLDDAERAKWSSAMADRRKKGMERMKSLQSSGAYAGQLECPCCNGANDATKGK